MGFNWRNESTVAHLVVHWIVCIIFEYFFRMPGKRKRTGQGVRSLHRIGRRLKAKKSSIYEIVPPESLESVEVQKDYYCIYAAIYEYIYILYSIE